MMHLDFNRQKNTFDLIEKLTQNESLTQMQNIKL